LFSINLHTLSKTTFVAPFNSTDILTPESAFGITIEGGGREAGGANNGGGGGKIISVKKTK
jgi:hypothetical protein